MIDKKKCPECGEYIDHLYFSCKYEEYGDAFGNRWPNGDEDIEDSNCRDSDYSDYEYGCPECKHPLDYDFFDQTDDIVEVVKNKSLEDIMKLDV